MKELKRIRLGNYLLGMRVEKLPHTVIFRSMFSKVADTSGVLNKFMNTDKMCLFIDLDDKNKKDIPKLLNDLKSENLSYILMMTSENHFNIISPTLIHKDKLDRLMKKYNQYMDYRFMFVYFRDGYNAMRIVPKIVDNKVKRPIKILSAYIASNTISHSGLLQLIFDIFQTPLILMSGFDCDGSKKTDCIIREYETINW